MSSMNRLTFSNAPAHRARAGFCQLYHTRAEGENGGRSAPQTQAIFLQVLYTQIMLTLQSHVMM